MKQKDFFPVESGGKKGDLFFSMPPLSFFILWIGIIFFGLFLICYSPGAMGQVRLDVLGDAKIRGRLDLADISGGETSVYIGKNAGVSNLTGVGNTYLGSEAGSTDAEGNFNILLGYSAAREVGLGDYNIIIGVGAMGRGSGWINRDIVIGDSAMYDNEMAGWTQNVVIGSKAMRWISQGYRNTVVGFEAGKYGGESFGNTYIGNQSGYKGVFVDNNTFVGDRSGYENSYGNGNTFLGAGAGYSNIGAGENVFVGYQTGESNTTGAENTFVGRGAGIDNVDGEGNTFIGAFAGYANGSGSYNVILGNRCGVASRGSSNVFIGHEAGHENQLGNYNVAVGERALHRNNFGSSLVAVGYKALENQYDNDQGLYQNTAVGALALRENEDGYANTALGNEALRSNYNGSLNTAVGNNAMVANTAGHENTVMGNFAADEGTNLLNCTSIGARSDVGIGSISYTNATAIGYDANATSSNMVRIGNTSVSSIGGQVGWSTFSDGRFKKNVKEDVHGLDFISELRPVSYQWDIRALEGFIPTSQDDSILWKEKYDVENVRFTGFIAQEVEYAATSVGFDFSGIDHPQNTTTPYALRYAEFVVPLVKAVQEQQSIIEELSEEIQKERQYRQNLAEENRNLHNRLSEVEDQLDELFENCCSEGGKGQRSTVNEGSFGFRNSKSKIRNPESTWLGQNIPNPFDQSTRIEYFVPEGVSQAQLQLTTSQGLIVALFPLSERGKGEIAIEANLLSPGSYFYSLIIDGKIHQTRQMVIQ